ncbi:hypothetical protein A4G20_03320 [Pasteurellaceae bacterium RH1A]|nr:hypothetical protein A4G20_03320 [Pasteurellaceae bacterium RH1A]
MKNVFKFASLSATLALAMGAAHAADKIGFISPEFIMANHPAFVNPESDFVKAVKKEEEAFAEDDKKFADEDKKLAEENKALEAEGKKLQTEQAAVEKSIKQKAAALEKEAPRLRSADIKKRQDAINAEGKAFERKVTAFQKKEDAFRKKVADFQKRAAEFQDKVNQSQRALAVERAKVQEEVIGQVNDAIKKVAANKGYTLVLDAKAVMFTTSENDDISEEVLKEVGGTLPVAQPTVPAPAEAAPAQPAPESK